LWNPTSRGKQARYGAPVICRNRKIIKKEIRGQVQIPNRQLRLFHPGRNRNRQGRAPWSGTTPESTTPSLSPMTEPKILKKEIRGQVQIPNRQLRLFHLGRNRNPQGRASWSETSPEQLCLLPRRLVVSYKSRSTTPSLPPMTGAPYLARFSRDVGFHRPLWANLHPSLLSSLVITAT
jgi:hypothetical protein